MTMQGAVCFLALSTRRVVSSKPGKSNRRIPSIKHILIVEYTRKEREV